ncbi:hypothetical protein BKA65DRAFT_134167 [Rhexocercosporidium sp. MPI-PUGE-AT-0058]|nr:hypothetical protein BKA65DRAFT_134167 [Rhexocercosporidium sp. MPI-PUGE-AT-0058]
MVSSDTTSEPPVKRQKVVEARTLLKDLPADEFQKKATLYNGPMIAIQVREKEFMLSEPLLCHFTSFFDEYLKSPTKEGEQRKLVFDECSSETFQLVFQWIYFSHINVPTRHIAVQDAPVSCSQNNNSETDLKVKLTTPEVHATTPASSRQSSAVPTDIDEAFATWSREENIDTQLFRGIETNEKAQSILHILAFLKLADKIKLLSPFDSVVAEVKTILLSTRAALLPGHIRLAAVFPPGHPVRNLIADACVREFTVDMFPRLAQTKVTPFRFSKELDELDGFAADLMRAYKKAPRKKGPPGSKKDGPPDYQGFDPLSGGWFRLPAN